MEAVDHTLDVKADAAAAFAAVATQAGIRGWWAKNSDVGETKGAKSELRFSQPGMSATMNFETTALDPGRRVEWTCTGNTNPIWPGSKMTWDVAPDTGGSTVHFHHRGFVGGE